MFSKTFIITKNDLIYQEGWLFNLTVCKLNLTGHKCFALIFMYIVKIAYCEK